MKRRARTRVPPPIPQRIEPPHRHRLRIALVLVTFTSVFVTLSVVAHSQMSGTWDEPMHLASGYVALAEGNYLLDPAHPPFGRMWAALPLLWMSGINVDRAELNRISSQEELPATYEFARLFVYVRNDADRLLFAARNMVVVWGVLLGVLVFAWTHEWLGFTPAVIALIFYTLEPNLAAHTTLVTTDIVVTCATFGALYFLWRVCRRGSRWNVAGLAAFFALATVTKFSGLILLPMVGLVLAVSVFHLRTVSMRQAAAAVVIIALTTYASVWAVYGFQYAPADTPHHLLQFDRTAIAQQNAPSLAAVVGRVEAHHLLPNAFTQGLLYSQASSRALPAFLAGQYSADGWWYYFPVAFLLKTPAALVVLLAAGLFASVRRHSRVAPSGYVFVLLPIVVYLAVAMTSGINIGVRHILPIYPFVLIVAAAGATQLLASGRRGGRIALAAVTAFWAVTFALVYPNTLTFFNSFVGGPGHGFKYLSDSNLDWGQHLKLLKTWMDANGVKHINLAYFGTADPAYYGIECTHLPGAPTFAVPDIARPRLPGYVAISATVASGVYLDPRWRLFYRSFRDKAPVANIGNSIRVYWVDQWPESSQAVDSQDDVDAHGALADALLFGQHWIDHAVIHYERYLDYRPADAVVMTKLGVATAARGHNADAIVTLRRAVALDPDSSWSQRVLAEVLLTSGRTGDASVHAERAVALAPTDAAAHDVLGVTLVLRGRPVEAKRRFERALTLNPSYAPAREHIERLNEMVAR